MSLHGWWGEQPCCVSTLLKDLLKYFWLSIYSSPIEIFCGERGRQSSRSLLANSLIWIESIKSDPVQIVVKNYLRFHQTEIRSVWSNVVSMTEHRRQVDSLSVNLKQTALTLSFSPWSVLLTIVESMSKGTSSIRQSGLEIVWQLLCAANCKRHGDYPLTFLVRISMIDSSVS